MRLVGPNGEQVGIVRVEDALRLAAEADLDLVEVAPMAKPPVCKLMDFGKFKYEAAIKEREARKNQVNTVIKEIKLRPKIDPHDYGTKKGHVERFLKAGDKVKVTIMFRGREQSRPELGYRLLQRLAEDIGDLGFVESNPKQDGRNMIMVLGPTRKKAEAKAEQRRKRDEDASGRTGRTCRGDGRTCRGDRRTRRGDGRTCRHRLAGRGVTPPPAAPRPQSHHRTTEGDRPPMPKMKSHSGTKKRFRITGSGKVMREQAGGRHLLEHKSSKKTRSIANDLVLPSPRPRRSRSFSASNRTNHRQNRAGLSRFSIDTARSLTWHA